VILDLRQQGLPGSFGDGMEAEFVASPPIAGVPWVVTTLPDLESIRGLMHALREHGYGGPLSVVARDDLAGLALETPGVPAVLYPVNNAADYALRMLADLIHSSEEPP